MCLSLSLTGGGGEDEGGEGGQSTHKSPDKQIPVTHTQKSEKDADDIKSGTDAGDGGEDGGRSKVAFTL